MTRKQKQSTEAAVREIRRRTRRKFAPEEKIRIVLEGLRAGEQLREEGDEERYVQPVAPVPART